MHLGRFKWFVSQVDWNLSEQRWNAEHPNKKNIFFLYPTHRSHLKPEPTQSITKAMTSVGLYREKYGPQIVDGWTHRLIGRAYKAAYLRVDSMVRSTTQLSFIEVGNILHQSVSARIKVFCVTTATSIVIFCCHSSFFLQIYFSYIFGKGRI